VRVLHDVPKYAHLQGLFALGNRRVGNIIERMAAGDTDIMKQGSEDVDIDSIVFRKKDFSEILPWDFIDAGVSKEHLWNEYRKALAG